MLDAILPVKAYLRESLLSVRVPTLLLYISGCYSIGLYSLCQPNILVFIIGVLLVGHCLTLMAYLIHDCAHHSVFSSPRYNDRLGELLNILVGTAYTPYAVLRTKHMRHHIDKVDSLAFDYQRWLSGKPNIKRIIQIQEWLLVPATEFLFHWRPAVLPFVDRQFYGRRHRVIIYGLFRLLFFVGLAMVSHWAVLGYFISYCVFLTILRLMDLPQHSFETVYLSDEKTTHHRGDKTYEQQHTFSNPLPWGLNWLVLNFGFHNEHHRHPTRPWYQLGKSAAQTPQQPTSFHCWDQLLRDYWVYRCKRLNDGSTEIGRTRKLIGSYGLSFLTVD